MAHKNISIIVHYTHTCTISIKTCWMRGFSYIFMRYYFRIPYLLEKSECIFYITFYTYLYLIINYVGHRLYYFICLYVGIGICINSLCTLYNIYIEYPVISRYIQIIIQRRNETYFNRSTTLRRTYIRIILYRYHVYCLL